FDPDHEIISLDDYYRRYQQYHTDSNLLALRAAKPISAVWDDHEIANDGWVGGAENHDPMTEGPWSDRRMAATQAYFDWLPIREAEYGRVYRQLPYGDLVDIIVLDTRYEGRDEQIPLTDPDALTKINAEDRQLLGAEQEAWCFDKLSNSTAQWKLLAQQVMVGQIIFVPGENGEPNKPFITDPWDGYDAARRRLLGHIKDNGIRDVVVLTGDIHSSFVNELVPNPYIDYDSDTGTGAIAVEFVTPGITSPGLSLDQATIDLLLSRNPQMRWLDVLKKGYLVIDVDTQRIHGDYFHYTAAQVGNPEFTGSSFAAAWAVTSGTPRMNEVSGPIDGIADAPPLAP
ncbi:MAG: alkaline phosphatase D family protein, partial [Myxococcales bacterium]|nr:alkaline phosphatase D family protein [Myxococcales bacterium]